MSRARSAAALLATVALLATAAPVAAEDGSTEPMTEEDVVRMYVSGRSVESILDEIARRPAGFDLSDEMIEELRRADIPQELIGAMQARARPAEPHEVAPSEPARATLRVTLTEGRLELPATTLPDELAEQHGLGTSPEARTLDALAVFLACRSAEHVPDFWRTKSPMGLDFVRMPRHVILAFHSNEEGSDLELPTEMSAELEPGLIHDLVLGVAARVGDRWLVVDIGGLDEVTVPAEGLDLAASIAIGSVEFLDPALVEAGAE